MDSETNFKAVATPGAKHLELGGIKGFRPDLVMVDDPLNEEALRLENTRLKQRILTLSVRLANLQKREEHFDQLRLEHTRRTLDELISADIVAVMPDKVDQLKLGLGLVP